MYEIFPCILFQGPDDPNVVNLPNTVTVSENSDTGTVVFTIQSAEQFDLINQYPAVTSEAFQYEARSKFQQIVNNLKKNSDINRDVLGLSKKKSQYLTKDNSNNLVQVGHYLFFRGIIIKNVYNLERLPSALEIFR